jgi:predicted RNase H-like nuclease (RuvC/YqgF family)
MRPVGVIYTTTTTAATPKETKSMDTPERIAKLEAQVENIKESVSELKDDVKEIHSRITTGNREIVEKLEAMDSRIEHRMKESSEISQKQHAEIQASAREDIDKIAQRVDVLERWRYMIVGGAIALGYLVSHLEVFSKMFK